MNVKMTEGPKFTVTIGGKQIEGTGVVLHYTNSQLKKLRSLIPKTKKIRLPRKLKKMIVNDKVWKYSISKKQPRNGAKKS